MRFYCRYGMFGDAIGAEDLAKMTEHRVTHWAGLQVLPHSTTIISLNLLNLQVLLGEKAFFGGDKPSIADFWVAASVFSWERNSKGKEAQVGHGTRSQDTVIQSIVWLAGGGIEDGWVGTRYNQLVWSTPYLPHSTTIISRNLLNLPCSSTCLPYLILLL
jgi:hypothetical protein